MPKCPMRITHRVLSFRWFVGLLTYPFMCRQLFCTNALLQPSRGAMTALQMTGFHRAQISLHGKQYFRNTATLGNPPRYLLRAEQASFRVRDLHPIPLFSEQACASESVLPSGRACATKAMLFSCIYHCVIIHARKKTSPAQLNARQKKS